MNAGKSVYFVHLDKNDETDKCEMHLFLIVRTYIITDESIMKISRTETQDI